MYERNLIAHRQLNVANVSTKYFYTYMPTRLQMFINLYETKFSAKACEQCIYILIYIYLYGKCVLAVARMQQW